MALEINNTAESRLAKRTKQKVGHNAHRLAGWKERLIDAAGKMTYRQIAENALGPDGIPVSHTTIRSVFLGKGGCHIETLTAICDGIGIDVVKVLGGLNSVPLIEPRSRKKATNRSTSVEPVSRTN